MQNILVAGGLGFIGSNFILMLLESDAGYRVANLDAMTYAGNPLNLKSVEEDPRYAFHKGDAADAEFVESVFGEVKPDAVVNFVAESHVDRSISSTTPFVHSNVLGAQVMLDACLMHGTRMLQVSTDEVYGSLGDSGAFSEDSPIQPNNPYSATKAAADMLCRAYHKTHGLDVVVTRCSNNYGPRQFPEKLIPLMIHKALAGEQLPVYGDGMHVRDWIYVDDHCRALLAVMQQGRAGEVYNIGGGNEIPNLRLVEKLLDKLDKSRDLISHVADRPGHDRRYAIDCAKLKTELSWRPEVDFEQGIAMTVDWYKRNADWLAAIAQGTYQNGY